MEKHSPGPWKWVEGPAGRGHLEDANGDRVAEGGEYDWGDDTTGYVVVDNDADARLIAEVPAFLALARYAAERGEGDAEMAREILARIDSDPGV